MEQEKSSVGSSSAEENSPAGANMVKQCSVIFGCLAIGELMSWGLSVPIPGSIIGLLVLTAALQMKIVKISSVKGISTFLISNMGFFFVPPGVALMLYFDIIAREWIPITAATIGSTVIVLIVTGLVLQYMHKRHHNRLPHNRSRHSRKPHPHNDDSEP